MRCRRLVSDHSHTTNRQTWVSSKRNFADFGANVRNDDITAARANARNNAKPVTALQTSPPRARVHGLLSLVVACRRARTRDKRQQNSKDLVRCYQDQPSPLTQTTWQERTFSPTSQSGGGSRGLRWACARVRARGAKLVPSRSTPRKFFTVGANARNPVAEANARNFSAVRAYTTDPCRRPRRHRRHAPRPARSTLGR